MSGGGGSAAAPHHLVGQDKTALSLSEEQSARGCIVQSAAQLGALPPHAAAYGESRRKAIGRDGDVIGGQISTLQQGATA